MFDKFFFSLIFFIELASRVFFFLFLPLFFLPIPHLFLFDLLLDLLLDLPLDLLLSPGKPKVSNWGPNWAEVTWGVSGRGRGGTGRRRRIRRGQLI